MQPKRQIVFEKTTYKSIADRLRIHAKWLKYRYVDVTTILVKIQISKSDIRNGPIQQGSKDLPWLVIKELAKSSNICCLFRVEQLYLYSSYNHPTKILILIRNRRQTVFP
jgi:hypothetical protein